LKRLLIAPALAVLLSGCGIAAKVNARHDMEASRVAYKACLAQHGRDLAACEGLRHTYEADLSAYQATSAALRSEPVYSYQDIPAVASPPPLPPMHDFVGDGLRAGSNFGPPDLPPVSISPMHSCINTGNFAFCR
jgi:hypothetical protein